VSAAVQPLVSVVMPTFERMQFVPQAVHSLYAQSYRHWELIIADDGSGPHIRAYLETLRARQQVTVLWLEHSGRPSVARNAALRAARGALVAFLDSDDLWLPEKLARQVSSLRQHPERKWGYTAFALVNERGEPRPRGAAPAPRAPSGWILRPLLDDEIVIALPSVIVERATLERLGAFDEALTMCEDDELWFRLAAHSEIDGIDAPLTLVRRHAHHGGDDVTAWRDRRRVFEKALSTSNEPQLRARLRRLRAESAVGLARSEALAARRARALGTLALSAPYSWRYPQWWTGAARTLPRLLAPAGLRPVERRGHIERNEGGT
jgi:glycosyltransferase involved in cell wall biosynthesis